MSRFRKWILRIAFGILEDIINNKQYKKEFIEAVNKEIDLPGFTEEEETELFNVLYDTFGKVGLNLVKTINGKE